jgi:anaerobic magnesium-protoporphyrin IX monomethyl ester cyclase
VRLLFVRPPKYIWPYINEQDNYLLPQALVCLGAEARRHGHEVILLDCMPLKIGWRSLEQKIRELTPQVVLAGDSETLYAHESGRVFKIAKSVSKDIFTVAGGVHFSYTCEDAFAKYPIDAIVRGEGERTITELLQTLEGGGDLTKVKGLALPDGNNGAIYTGHRELIENLDELPVPAYDLLPMNRYGTARYLFSPGGVTIHHSRGCVSGCSFCACWIQMAKRTGEPPNEQLSPRWRTRSVEPVIDEMELLAKKYGKKCLVFVDDTWNVDPVWSDRFADELLRRKLDVNWFAFFRPDFMLRDEESGLFEKLIASGLTHICTGLERADDKELDKLEKHNTNAELMLSFIPKLRKKYPSLFLQTTFIVGLKQDTKESMDRLLNYVEKLNPDYPAFHPVTPVPGTQLWKDAKKNGLLEITDFAKYDWMTPVMRTDAMARKELELKIWEMNSHYLNPFRVARGIFSPNKYRRRMYIWWLVVSVRAFFDYLLDRILPSRSSRRGENLSDYVGLVRPKWHDS